MPKNDQAPAEGATDTSAQSAPPAPAPKKPDDGKRTPEEWAKELGQTIAVPVTRRRGATVEPGVEHRLSATHAAAATLHGWGAHAYHANEPIRLSKADYEAAIKAVLDWGKPNPKFNAAGPKSTEPPTLPLTAHEPALSPHHPLKRVAEINARIQAEMAAGSDL